MAFSVQVVEEGFRNYIINVTGSGASAGALLVDVSTLHPPCSRLRIRRIRANLPTTNMVSLLWDATSPVVATLTYGGTDTENVSFEPTAGLPNDAIPPGVTGDVLFTTDSTAPYSIYIEFIKSDPNP